LPFSIALPRNVGSKSLHNGQKQHIFSSAITHRNKSVSIYQQQIFGQFGSFSPFTGQK
jgi:hypothetical protein